jgi:hypothetical protein
MTKPRKSTPEELAEADRILAETAELREDADRQRRPGIRGKVKQADDRPEPEPEQG